MRILYVGALSPNRNGAALRDSQLLAGLAALGHDIAAVALVCSGQGGSDPCWLGPRARIVELPLPLPDDPRRSTAGSDLMEQSEKQVLRHLQALFDQLQPDLLLAARFSFVPPLLAYCRSRSLPVAILSHWALPRDYPARAEIEDGLGRADLVICCARHVAGALASVGVQRLVAIPNGVDTARFRPQPPKPALRHMCGIPVDATIVLHVSDLKPVKRVSDLIESVAIATEGCPYLLCLIAGDGPEHTATREAVNARGLGDRFRFAGWISQAEMVDHLALADMVVMPSASEGMSLACQEAMACGKLVIASDIPGSREIIRDGETGLLFHMTDARDLAAKTVRAARDPELRARIGRVARAHVERHHRLDDMVARYEAVLTDLIERRFSQPHARGGGDQV